tara:strand:+ start:2434 stop:3273 length:840 start_codon:yes stop_codon:yes gene_type:complete
MDDWTRLEVEAVVEDYLAMLSAELSGTPYNKSAHRRALLLQLNNRSESSVEFKHANISAALVDVGFPYINGYKPRFNYQQLLADVLSVQLSADAALHQIASASADQPMAVPEVEDILAVLEKRPAIATESSQISESVALPIRPATNYIEREARNRSLGKAGEYFAINFERARLIHAGCERLAAKIEHTAVVKGDSEGYDILSYEASGAERLIEVKTTKYGNLTPFFVSSNEVATSTRNATRYQVYRLFTFQTSPRLFVLPGAIADSCLLTPKSYLASIR